MDVMITNAPPTTDPKQIADLLTAGGHPVVYVDINGGERQWPEMTRTEAMREAQL